VLERLGVALDGAAWVERMRTPPAKVVMVRLLLAEATRAQRAALEIQDMPWGLSLPVSLIRGSKPDDR
jgi:hypothetical protein